MDLAKASPKFTEWMWSEKVVKSLDFGELAASGKFPMAKELLTTSIMNMLSLSIIRYLLESYAFRPIFSRHFKSANVRRPLLFKCLELEKVYDARRLDLPDINEVKQLSTRLGHNVEDINRWFKQRQIIDREEIKISRCTECLWRLIIYSSCFSFGLLLSRDEPWFTDTNACWTDLFSINNRDADLRSYYARVQLPLYAHLLLKALGERRAARDRWEMLAHHALAVVLLTFSYLGNFLRLGCLAMLYFDITDLFLESSKLLSYMKWSGLSNLLLAGLVLTWGYARIYKFASVILYSAIVESKEYDVIGSSYYFFVGLLLALFGLNLYWFYAIGNITYRIMWSGGYETPGDRDTTDLSTDDGSESDADY